MEAHLLHKSRFKQGGNHLSRLIHCSVYIGRLYFSFERQAIQLEQSRRGAGAVYALESVLLDTRETSGLIFMKHYCFHPVS